MAAVFNKVYYAVDYAENSKTGGINEAITAMRRNLSWGANHELVLPEGEVEISETIQFGGPTVNNSQWGLRVRGWGCGMAMFTGGLEPTASAGGTRLKWVGPPGLPMMSVFGVRFSSFEGFMLWDPSQTASVGLDYRGNNATSAVSSENSFTHINIWGPEIGLRVAGDPVAMSLQGGGDQVDKSLFKLMEFRRNKTAVHYQSSQAVWNVFDQCSFVNYTDYGFRNLSGYAKITNGYWSGSADNHCVSNYFGAEANVTILDGGHAELFEFETFIKGHDFGPPALLSVRDLNIMKLSSTPTPLCDYTRRGAMIIDGIRFDLNNENIPVDWRYGPEVELSLNGTVLKQSVNFVQTE